MTILQARQYQPKDADLTAVAASGLAAAWTAYTPTVTAGSGAFTTVSATGKYLTIGKVTFLQVAITITTNGTAGTLVNASLPKINNGIFILTGRENNSTGLMLQATVFSGSLLIENYDNTYPGGSGRLLYVSGSYENT